MGERPDTTPKPIWLHAVVALLAAGTVVVTPFLALRGMFYGFCFMGCYADPHVDSVRAQYLTSALIVGIAAPVVGIVLSYLAEARGARWVFGIVLTITLIIAGLASVEHVRDEHRNPPQPPRTSHCRAYSGGYNDCPGG